MRVNCLNGSFYAQLAETHKVSDIVERHIQDKIVKLYNLIIHFEIQVKRAQFLKLLKTLISVKKLKK